LQAERRPARWDFKSSKKEARRGTFVPTHVFDRKSYS
jgi:hypothetical protein